MKSQMDTNVLYTNKIPKPIPNPDHQAHATIRTVVSLFHKPSNHLNLIVVCNTWGLTHSTYRPRSDDSWAVVKKNKERESSLCQCILWAWARIPFLDLLLSPRESVCCRMRFYYSIFHKLWHAHTAASHSHEMDTGQVILASPNN